LVSMRPRRGGTAEHSIVRISRRMGEDPSIFISISPRRRGDIRAFNSLFSQLQSEKRGGSKHFVSISPRRWGGGGGQQSIQ
jgi:hypothetical protein